MSDNKHVDILNTRNSAVQYVTNGVPVTEAKLQLEIKGLKHNMREAFKYLTEIDETRLTIESWDLVQNAREHLELEDEIR